MTFYIVGEKLPDGSTPAPGLSVIDHRSSPVKTVDWVDAEHTLASKEDGLSQYTSPGPSRYVSRNGDVATNQYGSGS